MNKSISDALFEMVGKAPEETNIVFVPTAANYERGDKEWLIIDLLNIKKQGVKYLDIVDISALPREEWLKAFEKADVLFFGGGNTFHLMYWVKMSGLVKLLPDLLRTKVYVGISAGSCVAGLSIYNSVQNLFGEEYKLKIEKGLGLVDFQIIPHLNSKWFKNIREEKIRKKAKNLRILTYVIDDQSAIKVVDGNIKVIGKGEHFEIL